MYVSASGARHPFPRPDDRALARSSAYFRTTQFGVSSTRESDPFDDRDKCALAPTRDHHRRAVRPVQLELLTEHSWVDVDSAFLDFQHADLGVADPFPQCPEFGRQLLPHFKYRRQRCAVELITRQVRDLRIEQPGTELCAQLRNGTGTDD